MKKRVAALLIAMLLWCTAGACAASYTANEGGALFTVSYDERKFALDQYSYLGSNPGGTWFFVLYDAEYTVDCGAENTDRGMGRTLRGAADMTAYAQSVCTFTGGEMAEVYDAGTQPFVIVSTVRPGLGQVYYAETVIGGRAVYFEIYNLRTGAAGDAGLQTLKNVLDGFMPLQ